MIVDTHIHYGGSSQTYEVRTAAEMVAIARAAGVDRIVQVTSRFDGSNAESIEGARRYPDCIASVIARVDVSAPGAIGELRELAAIPQILGFRVLTDPPETPDYLAAPSLDAVLAEAQKLGLVLQIFAPFQVAQTRALAKRHPNLRVMVDHMGVKYYKNRDNAGIFRQWPATIELAAEPNVWTKVSYFPEAGLAFETFPYPTAARYFRALYDAVGPAKLLWGSDFPVAEIAGTYAEMLAFVRDHCSFISERDRKAILGENFLAAFGSR